MTATPIRSTDDVIQFLVGQHEQIKALFETVLARSGKAREQSFFELRRLLAIHETAEEEVIHPRARRELDNGEPLIEDRLEEEHEAKVALAELETLDVDSDEFTRKITELQAAVLEHAEHEENEEFERLRKSLTDAELARMTNSVELAEAVAPTRPHPGVESKAENLLVGPFAAMLDRARDAIDSPHK
ncbi:hemerythrin domain-containing protein [Rhodococcus maanshanensis]|uniref:Hemerythrin HHE cation binding domain-containing protein n=1 Tax=Rhodococcus maanshanensis TaxID=183556 RepID=A0A1H7MPV5_9NOCA|nr:hemerythrin domain-containing protein [Rhodococcus maanshanensis]SEL13224.1 Hemerythrin HHE cation binding domain-containing protein [Rhodococcus maanshanensis]